MYDVKVPVVENMNIFLKVMVAIVLFTTTLAVTAQETISGPVLAEFPYAAQKEDVVPPVRSASGEEPSNLINPATYQFSNLSGVAFEDMSTGTTQLIGGNAGNVNSALTQIGFLFRFDGVFYTTFGASADGFIRLGNQTEFPTNVNTLDSTANSPKIAPYWDDICNLSSGKVHYKLVPGTIGVRKLVIEWKDVVYPPSCGVGSPGRFQIWLYDRTGVIQFVYGSGMAAAPAAQGGYSVGIQSGAATNFASVSVGTNSVGYTTANNTQTTAIPAGTSYVFTPNMPAAVSGLEATPGQTSATINWTDNATNETAYLVRRTTDHVLFYFVGDTLPANSTTFTDTGIESNTQYFYYVNALTDGAFGPDVFVGTTTLPPVPISSTAAGGPWSSPATWVGNVVPGQGDDVTIADGAAVVIDTQASARSVAIGSGSGAPASLKFGETGAFSLTTGLNITISSNGTLATGAGSANQHVLTICANLINNGVLDLSTNNNQAGAALVFGGDASSTFSGTGPVTDIRTITLNKVSINNLLDVSVSNFTVQGSTTDGPVGGYLFLVNGTYKVSGTFTANFRTFPSPNYQIPRTAGFELNNPNYTVTAQHSPQVAVLGRLKISAGTFNVGTQANDSLVLFDGGSTIVEGGLINTAGAFKTQVGPAPLSFIITGGKITTCTSLGNGTCFSILPPMPLNGDIFALQGGEIVLQNAGSVVIEKPVDMLNSNTVFRFGNEFTLEASLFILDRNNDYPDIVLDTRAIGHTLQVNASTTSVSPSSLRNLEIGPGGLFVTNNAPLTVRGESVVNNGKIRSTAPGTSPNIIFAGQNPVYSGSGTADGILSRITLDCVSLTLNSVNNIRVRRLALLAGTLINSSKLILGNNDSTESSIFIGQFTPARSGGYLDSAPVFELGTGGQNLSYTRTESDRSTGFEVNPARVLKSLTFNSTGQRLNIAGGDVTVTTDLGLTAGEIATGQNKIIQLGGGSGALGTISGELEVRFSVAGQLSVLWPFTSSPVTLTGQASGSPSSVSIRSIPGPLPGLLPATSVSRRWQITETGDVTANLKFVYANAEIRGNEANYQIWRSMGGAPAIVPFSNRDPGANSITTVSGLTDLDGLWGVGEMADPGPVSVSGSVFTSGGAGIRNAVVTISGGNLPAPVATQTGQFGAYGFTGLQAGEVYTITVGAKRFRFSAASQQVTPFTNLTGINFTANPQEEF